MVRRFPSPLVGVPSGPEEYRQVLSVLPSDVGEGEKISWEAFVDRCQQRYRNPETGEPYSTSYIQRILTTFVRIGFVDRDQENDVGLPEPSRRWLDEDVDYAFDEFLWHAIKRRWVLLNEFPRGVEGLREVHDAAISLADDSVDGTVSRGDLRRYLGFERDFEFDDNGIRGYPTILSQLGALEEVGDSYRVGQNSNRCKRRFSESDIFLEFERRLRREGAMVDPPDDRVKRDLSKYYIYRESGGLGKEKRFYETFWKDYLNEKARAGDTFESRMAKSEAYREETSRRKSLFDEVRDTYDEFESTDLQGLSADVLDRMRAADDIREAERIKIAAGTGISRLSLERLNDTDRSDYASPADFELYPWQMEAVDAWFEKGFEGVKTRESGIAQVVTGAGKTVMALEVIRRWLKNHPEGVVSVIVPTNVLMQQWLTELATKLNVPADDLGWAGGGHKDAFADGRRVMVCIINSATRDGYLGEALDASGKPPHLLVADECHRYTGDVFSNVFDYHRTAALGLSATPLSQNVLEPSTRSQLESSEGFELTVNDQLLLDELGSVYYTLTYDEGLRRGLIPPFTISYIGFELTPAERQTYQALTRKISNTLSDIRSRFGYRLDSMRGDFHQNLQALLQDRDLSTPEIADYFEYTSERRGLVADAAARQAITLRLLKDTIDREQKAIVFQERIQHLERMVAPFDKRGRNVRTDEVTDDQYRTDLYEMYPALEDVDQGLERLLYDADYQPVMYHSGHARQIWNDFSIEWFREDGFANVMLSVKALVEGVDVPSADIGIIRVSSSSVRQRIQTLGRILRTGGDVEKESRMYVLYARNTVDEQIFDRHDWTNELANASVEHLVWESGEGVIDGELREATVEEKPAGRSYVEPEVPDTSTLEIGDSYPGPRGSFRIRIDADGRPFEGRKNSRRYIATDAVDRAVSFMDRHGLEGTILVNEAGHLMTHREAGEFVYLGELEGGFDDLEYGEETGTLSEDAPTSLDELGFGKWRASR